MSSHVVCPSCEADTFSAQRRRPGAAEPALPAIARIAARIAGLLVAAVVAVGVAVHIACAAWARHLLRFSFPGVPARPGIAASGFLHNLHALVAVGGALLVAQSPYLATRAVRHGRIHLGLQGACDVLLVGGIVANVIVLGASFGAYGLRMVRAALPHGPFELAAYSLALALYIQGRGRPLAVRHVLVVAAVSSSALAAAALLETYVNL